MIMMMMMTTMMMVVMVVVMMMMIFKRKALVSMCPCDLDDWNDHDSTKCKCEGVDAFDSNIGCDGDTDDDYGDDGWGDYGCDGDAEDDGDGVESKGIE